MNVRILGGLTLFLFFLTAVISCSKHETGQNDIPTVMVNFSINPNSTEYLELNHVTGWVPLTGGYRGIIVYRKSIDEFLAFERACPFDWQTPDAQVRVDTSGITLTCPVCSSRFIIIDGSPYQGPSPYPLKQYRTAFDGNLLYVYN